VAEGREPGAYFNLPEILLTTEENHKKTLIL
jgi:hypothetical protein